MAPSCFNALFNRTHRGIEPENASPEVKTPDLGGTIPPFVDVGSGPPIVFLHGMELDWRLFRPQINHFRKRYRVIAYNLRARSEKGEEPYSLYDLVEDLFELLDKLKIGECVLVGMSMGGFTALRATHLHPSRFHALILLGSAGVPYSEAEIAKWAPVYESLMPLQHIGMEQGRKDAELHFSSRTRRRRPGLVDEWTSIIASRSGPSVVYEFKSWAYQDDLRPFLPSISTPTLLISGDEDTAVPLDMVLETWKGLKHARMCVVPFASHGVNLEEPEKVNAVIDLFLAELRFRGLDV